MHKLAAHRIFFAALAASLVLVSSSAACDRRPEAGQDVCPGGDPRESMCMDSGIRISNVDGADYSIDDTCVEKAKFEGYEVVPVSSACAWVVCLDALADDTCPNATRDQVYERWLQIADDREQPFGFRSDEGNRYKAVCTPTQPVDGKCCFLLEVAEATC